MIKKILILILKKILLIILTFFKFPKLTLKDCNIILDEANEGNTIKKVHHDFNETREEVDLDIIVPIHNNEILLNNCLESLKNQKTNYKYRVICVNDGSIDKSEEIVKLFMKKYKNILLFNEENKGVASARNLGIRKSNSKYIAFVDSDDYVTNNFVEVLLKEAYEKDADIVKCNYFEYNLENELLIKTGKDKENRTYLEGLKDDILEYKGYCWGGVYKSKLWEDVEFPENFWYEDMVIRMIIFRKAKVFSYINDKLYYYCIHDSNLSKKVQKSYDLKCLAQFFLVIELYNYSKDIGLKVDESLYLSILHEFRCNIMA